MHRELSFCAPPNVCAAVCRIALALTMAVPAQPTQESDRAREVAERILAPCCWREAVSVHQSRAAQSVREQIAAAVAAGEPDEAIIDTLVRRHGKRILREPEGSSRQWLYWIPLGAIAAAVVWLARRLRRAAVSIQPKPARGPFPEVEAFLQND